MAKMGPNRELKKYIRDSRSPVPLSENISRVMSSNKAKNTRPELMLGREFRHQKVFGLKRHLKKVVGRPDFVHTKKKVAVFLNGCYWHHCSKCKSPLPKTNRAFWKLKFARNIARDKRKSAELRKLGWKVVTIWEHEIKKDADKAALKVARFLHSAK